MEHETRESGWGTAAASGVIAGCLVALIVTGAIFAVWSTGRTLDTLRMVDHTRLVRLKLEEALISVVNVETAMRGFQLSGESSLIENIEIDEESCRQSVRALAALTRDNPGQQERVKHLAPLVDDKIAFTRETLRVRGEQGADAGIALFRTFKGERLMNEIRTVVRTMEGDEDKLLVTRSEAARRASNLTMTVIIGGSCLMIVFVAVATWTVRRELRTRRRAARVEAGARAYAESIVDTMTGPLLVLDREMRVERANRAFYAKFQTRPEEVEQRQFMELGGGRWNLPEISGRLGEALTLDRPFEGAAWEMDSPGIGRRSLLISGSKLHRPESHAEAVLVVIEDVTAQRLAAQVHAHFRALFESLPGLYLVMNLDLTIAAASDAFLKATMTRRESILGKGLFDVFPDNPDEPAVSGVSNLRTSLNRVLQDRKADTMSIQRYDIRRADGTFEERYWSPVNCPVFSPDREIEYIILRVEDVTDFVKQNQVEPGTTSDLRERMESEIFRSSREVEKANQQLRGLNEELEAFSYSVSHDLRAPLRHIDGFADMLTQHAREKLDDKGRRYLKTISDSAKRMGTLIDDLLVFSRMGRAEMRRTRVDLKELAEGVIKELEVDVHVRRVSWNCDGLPVVDGDHALLRQVFVNLLANALKYSRPRDPAIIGIASSDGPAEKIISIRDNGVGFDMAYVHKLFGVFQRLHRNEEFEGTGIGLANVQRIITRHGGRVWAESRIGEGATFHFSLPVSSPAPPLHPTTAPSTS